MRRALALARRGLGYTAPNPAVGAVVVAGGRIVGAGWHRRAGEPHAEVLALQQAGELARGADLYVTLEPCCHHGRTPPCTEAILAAGVARLFTAMEDPFPAVSGGGIHRLQEAGVEVHVGLEADTARYLNRGFLQVVRCGRPWVTLKMAVTLDGKTATAAGESRWITSAQARRRVHRMRAEAGAVIIGRRAALLDDPLLTCRLPRGRSPARVVVCGSGLIDPAGRLAQSAGETPLILALPSSLALDPEEARALQGAGVELLSLPDEEGRIDLAELLRILARRDLHSLLCEGGAGLAGALFDAGLVDEAAWFIAPKLLGGRGPGSLAGEGAVSLAAARPLMNPRFIRCGPDLLVTGVLREPGL